MKKVTLACILSLGVMFSSCLGPNNLQNKLNNWNAEVVEQDWIAESIYIPMFLIQAGAFMVDALVINTWDYWSGENPIADPGPFPADKFTLK